MKKIFSKKEIDEFTYEINSSLIEVHRRVGPGLLESVYHKCLMQELEIRKIKFESEVQVAVEYKGIIVSTDLKCDLFVEKNVVLELKSAKEILPIFVAQTLTYMKLLQAPKGIVANFSVSNLMHHGYKLLASEYYTQLPDH
jgi:GxxExxY protein